MDELREVDWRYDLLPDLVWIALLVHKLGYRRAVEAAAELAVRTQAACHWQLDRNLALSSAYDGITELWGAPGRMDTRIGECSMKPEVTFGYREEAAEVLYA